MEVVFSIATRSRLQIILFVQNGLPHAFDILFAAILAFLEVNVSHNFGPASHLDVFLESLKGFFFFLDVIFFPLEGFLFLIVLESFELSACFFFTFHFQLIFSC